MPVTHTKTVTIPDPTQADLDAQIALGNYPPGTVLADISLGSDWNAAHAVSVSVSEIDATGTPSASTFLRGDGSWAAGGGGGTWGSITGTLSDQADLQTALDAKAPTASPTFTGTVTLPAGQVVNGVTLTTGGGTSNFLRADGSYAAPSGGGVSDGDYGDITVSSSGTVWAIDSGVVSNAKLADMAANTFKARAAASSGVPSDVALSASQLAGRGSTGDVAAISLGEGLEMSTTTLRALSLTTNNYTSSTSMADPGSNCQWLRIRGIGGGGGGGSGRCGATSTARGGGSGGSAGAMFDVTIPYSAVTSWPVTITIGAGGAGGAGIAKAGLGTGNAGTAGGDTSFGSYVVGIGGAGGSGGSTATTPGGAIRYGATPAQLLANSVGTSGGASNAGSTNTQMMGAIGFAGAGGGGNGASAANAVNIGGNGGVNAKSAAGGAGGSGSAGTDGTDGDTSGAYILFGGSGGGGAGGSNTVAYAGGNGGLYGAGGGGGNNGTQTVHDSGAGGNGAAGFMQVIAY